MVNQDLLTYLCNKHKVPIPFVKFVDPPHWVECGGYFIAGPNILAIVKGTEMDPDLVLAHEFHHFVDYVHRGIQKGVNTEAGVQARAERDLAAFRSLKGEQQNDLP